MAKIEDLSSLIEAELINYKVGVADGVKKACGKVSEKMMEDIKKDSPCGKCKKYYKGWRNKVVYEDRNNIRIRTYNATNGQLTHLLEFGHAKRSGGRVEGKSHIRTNEEKAKTKLVREIERIV